MLTVETRINGTLAALCRVVNRTPCDHMAEAACECIAVYEVGDDGRMVFHRRSDGPLQLARAALAVALDDERWEGARNRACGEHRTTGGRAWCFDDREWCYPTSLCDGCESERRNGERASEEPRF